MSHDKYPRTPSCKSGGALLRNLCTEVARWAPPAKRRHGVHRISTHLETRSVDAGVPTEQRHTKWTDGPPINRVSLTTGSAMPGCEHIAISNNKGGGNG